MKWLWQQSGRWTLLTFLLREKAVLWCLLGFASIYLAFSFFEVPIWRCVWRELTGWRCPGCGLTTGCKALLRGDFAEAMAWNWFTPAVVLALLATPVILALPKTVGEKLLHRLEKFESRSRLVLFGVLLVLLQIFFRLQGWA